MGLMVQYTDSELAALIKQNAKAGFTYMYYRYAPLLMRLMTKKDIDKSVAETILQHVFCNAWASISILERGQSSIYLWMHEETRSRINEHLKLISASPEPKLAVSEFDHIPLVITT